MDTQKKKHTLSTMTSFWRLVFAYNSKAVPIASARNKQTKIENQWVVIAVK